MSEENVQAVHRANEAANRADWDGVAAYLDPDILVRADARWPEQRMYGREAAVAWLRGMTDVMESDTRVEEIVDLGDRVLVRVCAVVRGQHSEVEGKLHYSMLITFREGRIILGEFYLDHADALKALGLED